MLNLKGIYDQELIELIQNTIDDNHELIIGTTIVTNTTTRRKTRGKRKRI